MRFSMYKCWKCKWLPKILPKSSGLYVIWMLFCIQCPYDLCRKQNSSSSWLKWGFLINIYSVGYLLKALDCGQKRWGQKLPRVAREKCRIFFWIFIQWSMHTKLQDRDLIINFLCQSKKYLGFSTILFSPEKILAKGKKQIFDPGTVIFLSLDQLHLCCVFTLLTIWMITNT